MKFEPWGEDVINEYQQGVINEFQEDSSTLPSYLENVSGPWRDYYTTDQAMYQEVLTKLILV